jgi:hypothetical protein
VGVAELATTTETDGHADTGRVVTPSGLANHVLNTRSISTTAPLSGGGDLSANRTLSVGAASESASGVAELATTAETLAGTDDARIVTPAKLEAKVNATITVSSSAPGSPSTGDVWIDTS